MFSKCSQASFSGLNLATFSVSGWPGSKLVIIPPDPSVTSINRNLLFLSVFFLALFQALAILPHVKLNTVSPEHVYQRVSPVCLVQQTTCFKSVAVTY